MPPVSSRPPRADVTMFAEQNHLPKVLDRPFRPNGIIRFFVRDLIAVSPERAEFEFYKISNVTGIEPIKIKNPISVYPSPTKGIIYVKGDFVEPIPFEIFSSLGKKVTDGVIYSNNEAIDLSRFSSGVYLLKLRNKALKVIKTD